MEVTVQTASPWKRPSHCCTRLYETDTTEQRCEEWKQRVRGEVNTPSNFTAPHPPTPSCPMSSQPVSWAVFFYSFSHHFFISPNDRRGWRWMREMEWGGGRRAKLAAESWITSFITGFFHHIKKKKPAESSSKHRCVPCQSTCTENVPELGDVQACSSSLRAKGTFTCWHIPKYVI